jgi:hypothetical protein
VTYRILDLEKGLIVEITRHDNWSPHISSHDYTNSSINRHDQHTALLLREKMFEQQARIKKPHQYSKHTRQVVCALLIRHLRHGHRHLQQ